jgi:hypothetical protein
LLARDPGAVGDPKGGRGGAILSTTIEEADRVGLPGVHARAALLHVRRQGSQSTRSGRTGVGQDILASLGVLRAGAREVWRRLPVAVTAARCSPASAASSFACKERPVAVARPSLVGL